MFKNIKSTDTLFKKGLTIFLLAVTAIMFSSAVMAVQSLRGDTALDADANKVVKHKVDTVEGGIKRSFKLQPPMVPHTVEKYSITLKGNGCMKCHSEKAYKKEKAPKVGDSHYVDRDGKTLDTVSSRRYFCNQCHAPQVKSEPLVENVFEGI
ncbi:MAG: nitrate reductase cytochrome c-type subunit [Gammaproteobacteria bacterium]|nr:nitrate reductase cytochrome c-type subunit [Gammaproteobacteria bacterium]